jgi:dihydrofolate reductase
LVGGASLAQSFLKGRYIDEMILSIIPVIHCEKLKIG